MNARWEDAAAVTIKAATRSTTVRQKTEIISLDDTRRDKMTNCLVNIIGLKVV